MKAPVIVHYTRKLSCPSAYVLARFWKEREREQDEVTGVRQSESGRQPLQKVVNRFFKTFKMPIILSETLIQTLS